MDERDKQQGFWEHAKISRRLFLKAGGALSVSDSLQGLIAKHIIFPPKVEHLDLAQTESLPKRINGLHFPSLYKGQYQEPSAIEALAGTEEVSPNLIGIRATQFQDYFNSTTIGPTENTPDFDDLRFIIDQVHKLGYKAMLMPAINFSFDPDHWHGQIGEGFSNGEWQDWFSSYRQMIYGYADLAQQTGVELFVAGNEYVNASLSRPYDWAGIICGIKSIYQGSVTYAAHYINEFKEMTWASQLDLLGFNPYYKLTDGYVEKEAMKAVWDNIITEIEATVLRWNKDLLFTEIGYPSLEGASITPWNYKLIDEPTVPIDVNEQAICYQAFYESLTPYLQTWFRGGVLWNWDINPAVNGLDNKAYSPRGKPAAAVMKYYSGIFAAS